MVADLISSGRTRHIIFGSYGLCGLDTFIFSLRAALRFHRNV